VKAAALIIAELLSVSERINLSIKTRLHHTSYEPLATDVIGVLADTLKSAAEKASSLFQARE
jgi:hypothetical protein